MSKYDSIKEQIKKDYETTPKSLRQLAKEYNVSYDTVRNLIGQVVLQK